MPPSGSVSSKRRGRRYQSPPVLPHAALEWGRISEVLALTPSAIDIESGVANIHTLKRRKRGIVRQVPCPISCSKSSFAFSSFTNNKTTRNSREAALDMEPDNRMAARQTDNGEGRNRWPPCHAEGLRMGRSECVRDIRAAASGATLACHASLRTTSIYGDVIGPRNVLRCAHVVRVRQMKAQADIDPAPPDAAGASLFEAVLAACDETKDDAGPRLGLVYCLEQRSL